MHHVALNLLTMEAQNDYLTYKIMFIALVFITLIDYIRYGFCHFASPYKAACLPLR